MGDLGVRAISEVSVAELTAFVQERLPSLDAGLIRTQLHVVVPDRRVFEARHNDGALAGIAISLHPPPAPPGWVMTMVVTGLQDGRQGLGGRLWQAVCDHLDDTVEVLLTFVTDDDAGGLAAAASWGFTSLQHSVTSELDLTSLAPAATQAASDDVTVEVCDDLVFPDDDAVAAMLAASQTNPEAEAGILTTLEGLRRGTPGQRLLAVLARVGERPAAISVAIADGEEMHVVYTGVDQALRGRGLARRTKDVLHRHAAALGVRVALTDNEDGNAGIRHVNEQLGYVRRSGSFVMTRPR